MYKPTDWTVGKLNTDVSADISMDMDGRYMLLDKINRFTETWQIQTADNHLVNITFLQLTGSLILGSNIMIL